MKRNLTLRLDGDIIRRAKALAGRQGTSVSALVAAQLTRLLKEDDRYEAARERELRALANSVPRGGRTWSRDDLYDRWNPDR